MARYLVVLNLSCKNNQDVPIFSSHPEAEFLHTGVGRDIFGAQKRPTRQILADVRNRKYDLVISGRSEFPTFNPRKGLLKNLVDTAGKYLRQPHLFSGKFPYAKISTGLVGLDCQCCSIIDNGRFQELDRAICYFKRDLPQNPCNAFLYTHRKAECNINVLIAEPFKSWVPKLRPISLGINDALAAKLAVIETPKKTDVFFAGDIAFKPSRLAGIRQLEWLKSEGLNIDITTERLPHDEFIQRCARAYLVWSPEGIAWDCYRHYEAGAAGSVPLMQSPPSYRYAPFIDNENAIYYYLEGDHLAARIRQALQNRARLVEMGQAARQHVLQWHTHLALSRYVINETRRTLTESPA